MAFSSACNWLTVSCNQLQLSFVAFLELLLLLSRNLLLLHPPSVNMTKSVFYSSNSFLATLASSPSGSLLFIFHSLAKYPNLWHLKQCYLVLSNLLFSPLKFPWPPFLSLLLSPLWQVKFLTFWDSLPPKFWIFPLLFMGHFPYNLMSFSLKQDCKAISAFSL